MNFVITNSCDITVTYYLSRSSLSKNIIRINTDDEIEIVYGSEIEEKQINFIWNRRPFDHTVSNNEILQSELIESFYNEWGLCGWRKWINPPHINWASSKKLITLKNATNCGLFVPKWLVTNQIEQAKNFIKFNKDKVIVKPINHGHFPTDDSIKVIYTNRIGQKYDLDLIENCPTFFQEEIEKAFDVRVLYLNGAIICIALNSDLSNIDVRVDEMVGVSYKFISPPDEVAHSFIKLMHQLGLRFSASDFVVSTTGQWFFLENNPNGQWAWMDEPLNGMPVDFFDKNLSRGEND